MNWVDNIFKYFKFVQKFSSCMLRLFFVAAALRKTTEPAPSPMALPPSSDRRVSERVENRVAFPVRWRLFDVVATQET